LWSWSILPSATAALFVLLGFLQLGTSGCAAVVDEVFVAIERFALLIPTETAEHLLANALKTSDVPMCTHVPMKPTQALHQ